MQGKDLAIMLMMISAFATAGWVIYLVGETRKREGKIKAQAELNHRLLDKFSSAQEVVQFLQTPGGMQFVNTFSTEHEEPALGILRSTHRGIVMLVMGAGCLGLIRAYGWYDNPLLVIGVVLICLGLGFLISAAVSDGLSKRLGLRQDRGNNQ